MGVSETQEAGGADKFFYGDDICRLENSTIPEIKVTDGTLTIGVRMKCNAKNWETVDDFTLSGVEG